MGKLAFSDIGVTTGRLLCRL